MSPSASSLRFLDIRVRVNLPVGRSNFCSYRWPMVRRTQMEQRFIVSMLRWLHSAARQPSPPSPPPQSCLERQLAQIPQRVTPKQHAEYRAPRQHPASAASLALASLACNGLSPAACSIATRFLQVADMSFEHHHGNAWSAHTC